MNKKTLLIFAIIGIIVGITVLCIGYYNYDRANMFLSALTSDYIGAKEGNAGFYSWINHLENTKITLWIGGILTAIFAIMLIIGVSIKSNFPKFGANSNPTISQY